VKPGMLCLLLLSACSDVWSGANYRDYELTWRCLSSEGCERTEQVELLDRLRISNSTDLIDFWSSRNDGFGEYAQMVPSDSLPAGCSWLHGFTLFAHELEPSKFCRTSGRLELELSIPNRDPATHSKWFVEGRDIGP
jgi:hypothetical protein